MVAHAIGNDFGHGELAGGALAARLVIDRLGQAFVFGCQCLGIGEVCRVEGDDRAQRGAVTVERGIAAERGLAVALQALFQTNDPGMGNQGRRIGHGADGFGAIAQLGEQGRAKTGFGLVLLGLIRGTDHGQHRRDGNRANRDRHTPHHNAALFFVCHAQPPTTKGTLLRGTTW